MDFTPTLQTGNSSRPQYVVECQAFKLTVEPAVAPKTLWYTYQLVERTYNDVGTQLDLLSAQPNSYLNHKYTQWHSAYAHSDMGKWVL